MRRTLVVYLCQPDPHPLGDGADAEPVPDLEFDQTLGL